jgi:integrase
MKGHIRQRGHVWYAVIDIRDPVTRARRRKWISLDCKGKREAQVRCAQLVAEAQSGVSLGPSRITITAYLNRWLDHMRTQVSPRTLEVYAETIARIVPHIGNVVLVKLRPEAIAAMYAMALKSGGQTGKGLSTRSVHMMHRLLAQSLKQAARWQLIGRNPCDATSPPRVERREMQVLDADATAALIDAVRGRSLFMPIVLGVLCGLRRGEIAALRWRDVNFDAGRLSIVASFEQTNGGVVRLKPPKSGRSRTVALPALAVEELRRYRIKQAEDLLQLGIRQSDDTHVCLQPNYQPWAPRTLSSIFAKFIKASGLPRVRLHDLRHSHATHLLTANVHPKIVQERLGHANIATTMDLYTHVMPGMQDEAASRIDATLRTAFGRHRAAKG